MCYASSTLPPNITFTYQVKTKTTEFVRTSGTIMTLSANDVYKVIIFV